MTDERLWRKTTKKRAKTSWNSLSRTKATTASKIEEKRPPTTDYGAITTKTHEERKTKSNIEITEQKTKRTK